MKKPMVLAALVAVSFAAVARIPLTARKCSHQASTSTAGCPLITTIRDSPGNCSGIRKPEQFLSMISFLVEFGTPAQAIDMVFDTTAADTFVEMCSSKSCFDPTLSSTFRNGSGHFINDHKDVGYSGYDSIILGAQSVKYDAQAFGLTANKPSNEDSYGRLGLGFAPLSENNMVPVMQNIRSQLDNPVFSFWINREPSAEEGKFYLGDVDTENCDSFNYFPLSSASYWQFQVKGFTMGSYSFTKTMEAMISTMEMNILAAEPHYSAIAKLYGADSDGTVSCDGNYPDMKFTIGGVEHTIPSKFLIFNDLGEDSTCMLLVTPMCGTEFSGDLVLGQPLFDAYCMAFDFGAKRIGFAPTNFA